MALPLDLVGEILLRFPPADPASLVRAALVCKPWYHLICGPHFRCRFRELHRAAPMVGFFCNLLDAEFFPTSSFRPAPHGYRPGFGVCALDARHGRVLLQPWGDDMDILAVYHAHADGGWLGVARLDDAARLSLWSMELNPNNGDMGWTETRVLELDRLLPVNASSICTFFLGIAHGLDVFFVGTRDGLFSFDLKSGRVSKVREEKCDEYGSHGAWPCVVPYISFCTPALRLEATGEELEADVACV